MKEIRDEVKKLLKEQGADQNLADRTLDTDGSIPQNLLDTVCVVLDAFRTESPNREEKDEKK